MRDPTTLPPRSARPVADDIPDVLPAGPPPTEPVLDVLPADPPSPLQAVSGALPVTLTLAEPEPFRLGAILLRFPLRVLLAFNATFWWLFGVITLIGGLAVLAALPVLNFLSLGYLLEVGGRIARERRLRAGFVGVRQAARLGGIVLAVWLLLIPLPIIASLARDAELIEPGGVIAQRYRTWLTVWTLVLGLHVGSALCRGGKFRYFFWPFNFVWLIRRLCRGGYYTEACNGLWDFVNSLRLPYYFWLGLRGFVGGMLWLAPPITLLVIGSVVRSPLAPLVGFVGALLLAVALLYVPFLQVRFAAEGRFRSFLEVSAIRAAFQRAPWAFAIAFIITLASALPLYLLKIEVIPREIGWMETLGFVLFIFPARFLTGWAYARSLKRVKPRFWLFRWLGWIWMPPAALFFVLIVFFTQYTSWNGVWSLYEQHAFLLPAPFVGL
jgi:hypothetical protein